MKSATVVKSGEGRKFWVVGDHLTFKLGPEHSDGRYTVAEDWIPAGGGPPPHVHRREDELLYVLEGELEFLQGEKTFRGGAGTAVYLPKDVVHTVRVVSDTPARILVIAAPSGFERFVAQAGERFERIPHPKQIGGADIEKLLSVVSDFGLEIFPDHKPTGAAPAPAAERRLWVLGQLVTTKLSSQDTNGNFSVVEVAVRPGDGVPLHTHREMDEIFHILEGDVHFAFEDRTVHAGAGTLIHVPAGVWHGFKCKDGARMADIHTPGGFERFFEEAGERCRDPDGPPPVPDLDRVLPLFAKHGMNLSR